MRPGDTPTPDSGYAVAPGPGYLFWLRRRLRPSTYLEIGVDRGDSMAVVRPRTRALGVDPVTRADRVLPPNATVVETTSDAFFASGMPDTAIDLAFIDGLHHHEQVLRDLAGIEAHLAPGGVVVIDDVIPLDAATATRERTTAFWTGDVYKAVIVLARARRDLRLRVVPCRPAGLAVLDRFPGGEPPDVAPVAAEVAGWSYDESLAWLNEHIVLEPNLPAEFTLDDRVSGSGA